MKLTHGDVSQIIGIIDQADHLDEIELVFEDFRLHVRRSAGEGTLGSPPPLRAVTHAIPPPSAPVARTVPAAEQATRKPEPKPQENEVFVRAPMLGTFYRSGSPGEKPFVEVGQKVHSNDTVGIIEVMKLFNTIRAGVDGTVVRIDAENATLVEFDQPLIVIARD